MKVTIGSLEYTLYTEWDGAWTMHVWDNSREPGSQWIDTFHNVSVHNPFLSTVTYNAWR